MIGGKRCILIADDEPKMVRVLTDFLSASGFQILQAFDGEDALDQYYKHNAEIDLVLLDVMMPKADGFQVLKEIRESQSLTPVMMLTAREGEYDQIKGLELGADDYMLKSFSPTILLARIETMLRRVGKGGASDLIYGNIVVNISARTTKVDGKEIELTRREFDLLHYLLRNQKLTLTREQLLNDVWGYDFPGESRIVDTYIKQLRSKLKTSDGQIKTVHGVGYKFEVETP